MSLSRLVRAEADRTSPDSGGSLEDEEEGFGDAELPAKVFD